MILVIDNYDSFTYNLVQYIGSLSPLSFGNANLEVHRNDKLSLSDIRRMRPERIVISPGPGIPEKAGRSVDIVKEFGKDIPTFGICLGHQAIIVAYGGEIVRASEIVHGKTSLITHFGSALFHGVPPTFSATRYHSLIAEKASFPDEFRITSETEDGLIMSLEHEQDPVFGVQFHPESIATEFGITMIKNFLEV